MNKEVPGREGAGGLPRKKKKGALAAPVQIAVMLLLVAAMGLFTSVFYRSMEREVYLERTAYLKEITAQVVSTADAASTAQWDLASIFAAQLQEACPTREELPAFIKREEASFGQVGLSLLAFDEEGNYYDAGGHRVRWSGSIAVIDAQAPEHQVEITTLPTTTSSIDEMVFVQRMAAPAALEAGAAPLTHVAVVRDMAVFNEKLQVPSFEGQGENYIISSAGTKIYRGQTPSSVIGDVYNVLKPLEKLTFQYGSSYEELRQAVAEGKSCSLEFIAADGSHYYAASSPMANNGWSLLSIVPSEVVSARMQAFMNQALIGMGLIALVVVIAISLAALLVLRYRASQRRMRQQAEINVALEKAARAAQEASQAKTVFLSHMSHDIRTPINGIMGMTDIATRNMDDPARLRDCLAKITSASRHLLSLVNDVLDMSRIESGKVQIEESPFYVDSLLDGCYSVIAGQALEHKLILKKDFSGVTQPYLRGDELHLRQILINILGNAVKFTPEGGTVQFTARDRVTAEGRAELTVVIADNGVGMSEEFQQKIFEPFSQEDDSSRSKYQGTGLGMSIVKQLLDLMGGSVVLESTPGQGSSFTVQLALPIEQAPSRETGAGSAEANLSGMRVLLVEDNELNMEIAQYVLEDCGVQVTPAWNGQEAVEVFTKSPAGSFDTILMDVMMPVMDGMEAARAIRASGRADAASVPIVAMTANAYAEDRKAALAAGMDRHLTKPLERADLVRTLVELNGKSK